MAPSTSGDAGALRSETRDLSGRSRSTAPRLVIVTATTDAIRAADCIASWQEQASGSIPIIIIHNGGRQEKYLGTVPAFRIGVDEALAATDAEVICCFHDDLRIDEKGWDEKVLRHFDRRRECGLAGFGGAIGLGATDIYARPYDPMQLARVGFRSNMQNAEVHGIRSLLTEQVACLDGFSQIGRRHFWQGHTLLKGFEQDGLMGAAQPRPWTFLESLGVVHHFYDGMLGCLSKRYGWETWYLPIRCHHYGGRTAVGDAGYQAWVNEKTKSTEGDHEVWKAAHATGYHEFRDVLPLRTRT